MKYLIRTFGCQANEADSERIIAALEAKGFHPTGKPEKADLIIINSCMVRESAENRVYGLVKNVARNKKKKSRIILTGCLAGWALRDKSGKNLKTLKRKTHQQVEIVLTEDLADFKVSPKRELSLKVSKNNLKTAYIPISWGCQQFCTYCIVPYSRGKLWHRSSKAILKEVNEAVKKGFKHLTLLGENVNLWQENRYNFAWLVNKVASLKKIKLVEFISPSPWSFSQELIKVIRKHQNISRLFHLPLQSGDDEILQKMNRPYTVKDYLNLIRDIKKEIPKAVFGTDIIVGFPGETKKAFKNTVKLCKKVGFQKAYLSRYSPRPGTASAKNFKDDVSACEKKRRWLVLEKMINKKVC